MMPFRIPHGYTGLTCPDTDPADSSLLAYITWLEQELATARAARAARIPPAPGKAPAVTTPLPSPRPTLPAQPAPKQPPAPPLPIVSAAPHPDRKPWSPYRSRREHALRIARLIQEKGPLGATAICTQLQIWQPKFNQIVKGNPWFHKQGNPKGKAPWTLTEAGRQALAQATPPGSSTPTASADGPASPTAGNPPTSSPSLTLVATAG